MSVSVHISKEGPVRHHKRPRVECIGMNGKRCRKNAVFPSGRCGQCEDAHARRDFAVLESYRRKP